MANLSENKLGPLAIIDIYKHMHRCLAFGTIKTLSLDMDSDSEPDIRIMPYFWQGWKIPGVFL